MLHISNDGMYDLALASAAFTAMLSAYGTQHVREQLQSLLVRMHECQLQEFDPELQCQIDIIKDIDKAIIDARVVRTGHLG